MNTAMDSHGIISFNFSSEALLNCNCNASKPGNVNPEFGANEPGCGNTFSYNGGAGAGSASCCDSKPYEEGFNDKKRDATCCCESSRCYERPLANKKTSDCCTTTFKYVPEFNYPPPPCPPADSGCCNAPLKESAPKEGNCTSVFKYVPEFNYPPPPCAPANSGCNAHLQSNTECCNTYQGGLTNKKPVERVVEGCCRDGCNGPDTYESIANTDAQRYKGKGPDRKNFYADDGCCSCQPTNNSSTNNNLYETDTDWSEIRRVAYAAVDSCSCCSPKLVRRSPSFYCEEEHYVKGMSAQLARGR
ncbi:hypothetical protein EGW08_019719 [Elysia chlorotica]|uniref:Uncharacterized protein n=1 Tax=Elysia chlorotica TaxID=188477 RepID=A0A3S0ZPW6_ELYCH|nr:hypothetical protein EGW08_019719 [Elysia chlorotica]